MSGAHCATAADCACVRDTPEVTRGFTLVTGVAGEPFRLRSGLVVPIVCVDTKPAFLPVASTGALAGFRGAISLTGNMCQRHERGATGGTKAGGVHGAPPGRVRTSTRLLDPPMKSLA